MFRKSLSLFLTLWLCALPAIATGYYQASISAGAIVGIVPVANGGTGNSAAVGATGKVLQSDGTKYGPAAYTLPASLTGASLLRTSPGGTAIAEFTTGGNATFLYSNSGVPTWTTKTYPVNPTPGDIFYADGSGNIIALPKGAALSALRMNAGATAPEWFP